MPFKLLHTGDLHLGMTFGGRGYPEEVRQQLLEARFKTLENLVELADNERCQLFVVAGDLFHRTTVARESVARAAKTLSSFQGCVAVLPGNHDYYEPFGDMWKDFRHNSGDNLILMTDLRPYPLRDYGLDAVLYPAPCDKKHSATNRLGWIGELTEKPLARWHIGIAHGSVNGISPDFDRQYFPMEERELFSCGLHHWCLGHTHIRYPDLQEGQQHAFYFSGTPEPDGFDCRHEGYAWLSEIDDEGELLCRAVKIGQFRFREIKREVYSAEDLALLKEELTAQGSSTLVKLQLKGALPEEEYRTRDRWYSDVREALLYLEIDDSALELEITAPVINSRFPAGSFPHQLLTRLLDKGDREALQTAYRLISEVIK